MPKVYHPIRHLDVDASEPHQPGTCYRVSVGIEYWGDNEPRHVVKVQMVRDGQVASRRSPSYPLGTNDMDRVMDAVRELTTGAGDIARGEVSTI